MTKKKEDCPGTKPPAEIKETPKQPIAIEEKSGRPGKYEGRGEKRWGEEI
jgi:hypothetical protein